MKLIKRDFKKWLDRKKPYAKPSIAGCPLRSYLWLNHCDRPFVGYSTYRSNTLRIKLLPLWARRFVADIDRYCGEKNITHSQLTTKQIKSILNKI